MENKEIINNWITMQKRLYISGDVEICPICKREILNQFITKRSGFCLHCFINQIVMACNKELIRKQKGFAIVEVNNFNDRINELKRQVNAYNHKTVEKEIDKIEMVTSYLISKHKIVERELE